MVCPSKTEIGSTSGYAVLLRSIPGAQYSPAQDVYRRVIGTGMGSLMWSTVVPPTASAFRHLAGRPLLGTTLVSTDLSNSHASPFPSPGVDTAYRGASVHKQVFEQVHLWT